MEKGNTAKKRKEKGKIHLAWLIQMLSKEMHYTLLGEKIKIKYSTLYEFSYIYEFTKCQGLN